MSESILKKSNEIANSNVGLKKLNLKFKDENGINNFIGYLKRFSSFNELPLIEIVNGRISCSSSTVDRGFVKYSSIDINDVFENLKDLKSIKRLVIGVSNVNRLLRVLEFLKSKITENRIVNIDVYYQDFEDLSDESKKDIKKIFGTSDLSLSVRFDIYNEQARFSFDCVSYKLIIYISETFLQEKLLNGYDSGIKFDFTVSDFEELKSILNTDKYSSISLSLSKDDIKIYGKGFELKFKANSNNKTIGSVTFNKSSFDLLDIEDSEVSVSDYKIIIKSKDTDTISIVGCFVSEDDV